MKEDTMERNLVLDLSDIDKLSDVAKALSIPTRVQIILLVSKESMSVNEIAEALDLPISTVSMHVNVLLDAGLLFSAQQPGVRGRKKVCSRKIDFLKFDFVEQFQLDTDESVVVNMPIGYYTSAEGIQASCGIAGEHYYLSPDDDPKSFFEPSHFEAQLIWLSSGILEYKFPNGALANDNVANKLSFSLELCSEISNYRNDWPSDITIWINGQEVCTYTSPGDFGGRRGKLNPSWWSDTYTQYGLLKTFSVNHEGTFIDGIKASQVTIDQLKLGDGDYISFKIGVKADADNCGGLNIFGEKFGDYQQNIVMHLEYSKASQTNTTERINYENEN